MTKKNVNITDTDESYMPYMLSEGSPRDYSWGTFDLAPGLPEVNHFGYTDTKEAFAPGEHKHPNAFEFVYIEKGQASWSVNNVHYETKAGDLFYTRPDEYHSASNNIMGPCRIWHFGLRTPFINEREDEPNKMQQNSEDIQRILDGLYKLPRVTFLGSNPLPAFRRLANAIQNPGPHSRLDGRIAVVDLILQLLETSKVEHTETNKINYKIEKLIAGLSFQVDQKLNIEEMSARLGISVAYFYRLFFRSTGMTPRTYLERLRIREACHLLTETETSITTIAMNLGFATSQHFARVFHRLTGRTSTQWRQNKINVDTWFVEYNNKKYDFINLRES
jgi:AraC-like DNA-binding protein/mannose-6-phosphate isomerase-like protein (cupin superfamily)